MGAVRILALVVADHGAWRALHYRVEPSTRQSSSLVDPCQFDRLVAHFDHRATLAEHRRSEVSPLRHRRHHQPRPRLWLTYSYAHFTVLRRHSGVAEVLRLAHRPAIYARCCGIHATDRSAVQPLKRSHPILHR